MTNRVRTVNLHLPAMGARARSRTPRCLRKPAHQPGARLQAGPPREVLWVTYVSCNLYDKTQGECHVA